MGKRVLRGMTLVADLVESRIASLEEEHERKAAVAAVEWLRKMVAWANCDLSPRGSDEDPPGPAIRSYDGRYHRRTDSGDP
jgi:hypothetical protein